MRPVVPWCSPLHSPGGKDALCWEVISKYAKYSPFLAAKKPLPRMWVLKQISFATDLWPEVYRWYELSNACYCWYTHEGGMWGNICNNGTIDLLKVYLIYVPTGTPVLYLFMIDCMEQWSNLSIPYSIIIIKRQLLFKLPGVGRSVGGRKVATAPRVSDFFLTLELDNRAR